MGNTKYIIDALKQTFLTNPNLTYFDSEIVSNITEFLSDDSFFSLPISVLIRLLNISRDLTLDEASRVLKYSWEAHGEDSLLLIAHLKCEKLDLNSSIHVLSSIPYFPLFKSLLLPFRDEVEYFRELYLQEKILNDELTHFIKNINDENNKTLKKSLIGLNPQLNIQFHQIVNLLPFMSSKNHTRTNTIKYSLPRPNGKRRRSSDSTHNKIDNKTGHSEYNLSRASIKGDISTVKMIFQQNPERINDIGSYGLTPLHYAAREGHLFLVQFLIENRANINATDDWNQTPLHYASNRNHIVVAKELIKNGANINAYANLNKTPLTLAKSEEMKILLIENGAVY